MALGAFFSAAEVIPLTFLTVEAWTLPAARRRAAVALHDAVPAPLGGDVPRRRRLLELPRRRHLRLPHQPADRLLLRDRHRADRQPRPRRDDGRLRDARARPGAVLPALPDPGGAVAGAVGAGSRSGRPTSGSRGCASRRCCRSASCSSTSRSTAATSRRASSKFLTNDTNALLEWLRLPGDVVFIAGGAIPTLYIAYIGIRHTVKRVTLEEPEDILFTEIGEPEGVAVDERGRGDGGEADVSPEVVLFAGYAAALLASAARRLEWLSAHTHRRALRYRTAGFDVRRGARPLALPGGPAPVAARVRPRAPARALPRQGAHLQRLPAQGGLHRLRPRTRDRPAARSLAALGGRALPPRPRARARRARSCSW